MDPKLPLTDFDREIWAEELDEFVPDKIFDAHIHLWNDTCAGSNPDAASPLRWDVGFRELNDWSHTIFPGRKLDYLLMGTPIAGMDIAASHAFPAQETARSEHRLGSTIVIPQMTASELDAVIRKYHFAGLKPYQCFAPDPAADMDGLHQSDLKMIFYGNAAEFFGFAKE